jgi:tripartite-type tricarboxylate transporter receptor subunit TctC
MTKLLRILISVSLAATAMSAHSASTTTDGKWKATQPIRIVVPFAAGGGSDVAARLIAERLGSSLGETVVVENKPGASGAIASQLVYNADPNGYTILLGTADTQSMNPHVNNVRYDSLKYVPVLGLAQVSYALVGRNDLPANNLAELISLTKNKSLSYGSSGTGAAADIQMRMFADTAGIKNLLHVPYQGVAPAFQGVLSGQVDLAMVPVALVSQYQGKIKFYGMASMQRNSALPDVPTLAEEGYAVDGDPWVGLLAPPGTSDAIAETIAQRVSTILANPDTQKRLKDVGMTPYLQSREDFIKLYGNDYEKWGKAIRNAGITIQN